MFVCNLHNNETIVRGHEFQPIIDTLNNFAPNYPPELRSRLEKALAMDIVPFEEAHNLGHLSIKWIYENTQDSWLKDILRPTYEKGMQECWTEEDK